MSRRRLTGLRSLQGCHVGLALADGSRIDDCYLEVVGGQVRGAYVYDNGVERRVPLNLITDYWPV